MSRFRTGLALAALGVFALAGCTAEAAEGGDAAPETATLASADAGELTVTVYKQPTCGCCGSWIDLMREAGFQVDVVDMDLEALARVKAEAGVSGALQSCHTAKIGDYVFEGHVPIETIQRFLAEEPDVTGLAVPGMPVGSPGMEVGDRVDPYEVIAFDGLETSVYESRR